MVNDDVLFQFRLRLFSLSEELGNVRAACRIFGIHPSTYYRWRGPVLRSGQLTWSPEADHRPQVTLAPPAQAWLAAPGLRGRAHNDTDMRRVLPAYPFTVPELPPDWLDPYRDRWDYITTEPGDLAGASE